MRTRLIRLALMAGLVVLTHLASAPVARAGIMLSLTDQNTNQTEIVPSSFVSYDSGTGITKVNFSGTIGNFSFNVTGTSDTPGDRTGPSGDITNVDTKVTNTSATSDRLTITLVSDGFTIPGSGLAYLHSSISTSALKAKSLAFESYIMQQGEPHPYSTGYQVFTPNGLNNSVEGTFTRNSTSYTLASQLLITLDGGKSQVAQGDTSVDQSSAGSTNRGLVATPEPSTIVAALAGLPFLAIGVRLRRRSAAI